MHAAGVEPATLGSEDDQKVRANGVRSIVFQLL